MNCRKPAARHACIAPARCSSWALLNDAAAVNSAMIRLMMFPAISPRDATLHRPARVMRSTSVTAMWAPNGKRGPRPVLATRPGAVFAGRDIAPVRCSRNPSACTVPPPPVNATRRRRRHVFRPQHPAEQLDLLQILESGIERAGATRARHNGTRVALHHGTAVLPANDVVDGTLELIGGYLRKRRLSSPLRAMEILVSHCHHTEGSILTSPHARSHHAPAKVQMHGSRST